MSDFNYFKKRRSLLIYSIKGGNRMWKDITWVSNAVVVLQCISYIVGAFGLIGILVTIKQAQRADKQEESDRFRCHIKAHSTCDGYLYKKSGS